MPIVILRNIAFHILNRCFRFILNWKSFLLYSFALKVSKSSRYEIQFYLSHLRSYGYAIIPEYFANRQDFEIVCKKFSAMLKNNATTREAKNLFDHENKERVVCPIDSIPEITSLVFDNFLCEIICRYKKMIPGFQISLYKTFPSNKPQGSSSFHQDQFGDFSIFIALEDINEFNGATQFVPKSHQKPLKFWEIYFLLMVRKFFLRFSTMPIPPKSMFYSSEFVDKVYTKNSWIQTNAKKGSIILIDVSGIHRGPHWPADVNFSDRKSRSVLHIAAREKVLIGSGVIANRVSDNQRLLSSRDHVWSRSVIDMTNYMQSHNKKL